MIIRVKYIIYFFIILKKCEVIKGMFPCGDHSLFNSDLPKFPNEIISSTGSNWREAGKEIGATSSKVTTTSECTLLKGTGWDGGDSFTSFLGPSIRFIPVNDQYHHAGVATGSSNQVIPNFSNNDLFEGTGWDGKESFASLLEIDNTWNTVHSQNHGILLSRYADDIVSLEHSREQPSFNQPSVGNSFEEIIPNVPNSFRNSKFIRSVEKDSFKNQNIPLYHNTFDSSSLATIGEDKFTMGAHPYGDHSSLNKIISTNKNNLGEVIRRIDASDPKASSTFENHLLKGKGLDGGESFTSFLEPSINFIPGSDLFEGTGWDGKESFISLLEPYNTWDTFRSQNHAMLSSEYEDDAVPLKQSQSIMYSDPEFDNPTARGLKSLRPSILESSRKSDSLKTVKRKSFKKQKTGLNRKIVDASSLVTNGDAQIHSFQSIKKSIQMKNPSYEKFSNSWWSNIYLPDLINSLTTRDDPTSEFQIFLDRMDMLADDLVIAYEDKYFWKDLNVNYDKLLTKSLTEKIRSDNFKKKFGEIIDQGDEPFHISLIEKFKKDISNAGSTENLTQFLPLFEAMESQGKETGFFYINSGAHSLFRTKNSRRKSADSLGKLKIPKLDSNFYQVLSNQLNEIFFEDYFENDYRILKDRALLTYIKRKWVPKNLKAYREVLRVKIQIRNLYLTITTLINKLFCDGRKKKPSSSMTWSGKASGWQRLGNLSLTSARCLA
ncbi:hypothetical protein BY996DRAFT_6416929 [Phakopsora pachyrhizi]|nr:hypothetical protein BY996DRAFT_6416929 [Phakopsora pachyrhizi]